ALQCTGTAGQEWKIIAPATNAVASWVGIVADSKILNAEIGKVFLWGKVQADCLGHASLAANVFLEVINRKAFDGTIGNCAFVAGSGTTRDTITDSDNGLVTDGFLPGHRIVIAGSTSNDGSYEIYSVAAGTITLTTIGGVTSETAAGTIVALGYMQYDGAADTANSPAVAREAYTTTTTIAKKWVQLQGVQKVIAAS
ncbi:MAG: hypothetical protein ABIH42_09155, partial [Planctomycetota bacterium]